MSKENVDVMRQLGDAIAQGDIDGVERLAQDHVAPEFELHPLYFDRLFQGAEGARQMWADTAETWAEYHFEMEEIVDLGEHVLALARITGRGPAGGVPVDQRIAILNRFQGDKLVWAKSYASKREALEAVGLRE